MTTRDRTAPDDVVRRLAAEADALDHAVYDAVASTPTPTLDVPARWLSQAANYSVLSILIAGVLATVGGHGGRRAAVRGLTAIGATYDLREPDREARVRPTPTETFDGHRAARRTDADVGLFPLGAHRVGLRLRGRGDGGSSSSRVSLVRARNCRGVQPCSHGRALPK